jgi:pyridoxamine 5'-phosphate oxidase
VNRAEPGDPVDRLLDWVAEARARRIEVHDAVCLATASSDGRPSARMVLFKGVDRERLLFYTDYRSRKAGELDTNPHAALVFHWRELRRQIRVEGAVERLAPELSDRYFLSRDRGSRISAWSSHQSAPVERRETLERRRAQTERRFEGKQVTRPDHWGGYGLRPVAIEFWTERPDRFHERRLYRRSEGGWEESLLQP